MILKKFSICFSIFILLITFALAEKNDFPKPSGFVNDFAKVLNETSKNEIEVFLQQFEKDTTTEFVVVTVQSISPYESKEYAVKLFQEWKIGKKGKDNGLLMLLAIKEKRIEIEIGYGLEGIITDGLSGEILDKHVVPYFKQGQWEQGLLEGVKVFSGIIKENSGSEIKSNKNISKTKNSSNLLAPIIFFIFIIFSILSSTNRFSIPCCKKCKTKKNVKQKSYKVIEKASLTFSGIAETVYFCKNCNYEWKTMKKIPQKVHSAYYGGYYGGGFGESNFGGGSFSGGFGGGCSGGGGAGRSF
ncbi:MAG: TPM domain-containing protein [bacterium]